MSRYTGVARHLAAACMLFSVPFAASAQNYVQTNLVSDIAQPANADGSVVTIDSNLKNAWGVSRSASSPWWVNNSGTGTATLYSGGGAIAPLVVTIPAPPNPQGVVGKSQPTGMVFNGTTDFVLTAGTPAAFIFATRDGAIAGWEPSLSPPTAAIIKVDESKSGAVFDGLTWVEVNGAHFLLAANFSHNRVEAFDTNFKRVELAEPFRDEQVPSGFAPYNVQAVGDTVVVTYAKQSAAPNQSIPDDNCGDECGFVAIFSKTGRLLHHLESGSWLRAPWGVALAPQDFGFFSHALLIGNRFGGTIAAFDPATGKFIGNLLDANDAPIAIDGLWSLEFDNRGSNESGSTAHPSKGPALFFTAGINGYAHGLFGNLTPVAAQLGAADHE